MCADMQRGAAMPIDLLKGNQITSLSFYRYIQTPI